MMTLLAGCGSTGHPATVRPSHTPGPITPVERRQASVDVLLAAALGAVEHGYANGLNMADVEQQYGGDSAVYRTFAGTDMC